MIEVKEAPFAAELRAWHNQRESHRLTHRYLQGIVQDFERLKFWRELEYKFLSYDEEKQFERAKRKLDDFERAEQCRCRIK